MSVMDTIGTDNKIGDSVQDLIQKILVEEGFELVELQVKRAKGSYLVRVFIDGEKGIGINDCENVSQRISAALDIVDSIPGPYTLEVSSPGAERSLKKEEDFIRFIGHSANVSFILENGKNEWIEGKISSVKDHIVTIENKKGEIYAIPYPSILKSRLVVNFKKYEK